MWSSELTEQTEILHSVLSSVAGGLTLQTGGSSQELRVHPLILLRLWHCAEVLYGPKRNRKGMLFHSLFVRELPGVKKSWFAVTSC